MKSIFHPDRPQPADYSRLVATSNQAARRPRARVGIQNLRTGHITTPSGSYTQVAATIPASQESIVALENQPLSEYEDPAPDNSYEPYQLSDLPEVIGSLRHTARFKKEREWGRWKSTLPHLVDTYRQLLCMTDGLRQQPVLLDQLSPCLCASAKPSSMVLVFMDRKLTILPTVCATTTEL